MAQALLLTYDGKVSKLALIIIPLGLSLFAVRTHFLAWIFFHIFGRIQSITLSMGGVLAGTKGLRKRWLQELPLGSFESNGLICISCVPHTSLSS
ncbi:hypothetical protein BDR07DRAFT_226646 [Suillus spraguei]|nr:hypothetical protein BDR07DRAFT_226646 [Suillus spraguei]